ncbi:T9SS type A sorting domain-containing protein [uncultured Polaribacter sp.]|uniref:LamG-like jellyroll fold domain-containing protein n=1 Tax=uncultured Polaribacter sp. TaxID=174711 RepID=UPI0026338EE0|nr:T9SS type A sorting domain-containing protein [uncultured Polaribacter sp.]
MKILIILMFFCSPYLLNAQSHRIWWTFDSDDVAQVNGTSTFKAFDYPSGSNQTTVIPDLTAEISNTILYVDDRYGAKGAILFNDPGAAINFSSSSSSQTGDQAKFFGLAPFYSQADSMDEMTVSVWVNFKNETGNERIIFGASENPFSPIKFGLSLRNTTLYLKQYYTTPAANIGKEWDYELFKPGAFDAGRGWYHVTVIFAKTQKYMRVLIGKPNGGAEYGPSTDPNIPGNNKLKREFDGRLIWVPGIREKLKNFNYWGIRNANGLIFDDLMVYNRALTLDEAKNAYFEQKVAVPVSKSSLIVKTIVGESELIEDMVLYPNPTSGLVTISLPSNIKDGTKLKLKLLSLLGSRLWEANTIVQSNVIKKDLKNGLNLPSGIYIVSLEGQGFYEKREIYIE